MIINSIEVLLLRKRIKNIILRIDAQGVVKVSAPLSCPLSTIRGFLAEKQEWILRHLNRITINSQKTNEQSHWHLGKSYPLIMHETEGSQQVSFNDNKLCCFVKKNAPPNTKELLLNQWQRLEMKAILPQLIKKWEEVIGVEVNDWGIKSMRTRWGSCNPTKKRIWLNLQLMQKPLICLEYVVVHELVHLLEASHNQRFHALMTQFMPDWKAHRILLKTDLSL